MTLTGEVGHHAITSVAGMHSSPCCTSWAGFTPELRFLSSRQGGDRGKQWAHGKGGFWAGFDFIHRQFSAPVCGWRQPEEEPTWPGLPWCFLAGCSLPSASPFPLLWKHGIVSPHPQFSFQVWLCKETSSMVNSRLTPTILRWRSFILSLTLTAYLVALFWKCWMWFTRILLQLSRLITYQTWEQAGLGRLMPCGWVLLVKAPEKLTDRQL